MQAIFTKLTQMTKDLALPTFEKQIRELQQWEESGKVHIVFCGEFKRGKSTLVNALLGEDLSPTSVVPATALPLVFQFATTRSAEIHFIDGTKETFELSRTKMNEFSVDGRRDTSNIRLIQLNFPNPFLQNGDFVLIDTPGVNDLSKQRAEITYGFLPLADIAVVVFDATAPISRTESAFLTEQLFPNHLDQVIFTLGKIDRLDKDEDELEEAIEGASKRLSGLLAREVEVVPISAWLATQGHTEAIRPFLEALERKVKQSKHKRKQLLIKRLSLVIDKIISGLRRKVTHLSMNDSQKREAQLRLQETRNSLSDRLKQFFEYIEHYGRETLNDLIKKSLEQLQEELLSQLLHQANLCSGGFDDFIQKQIPHHVTTSIRQWSVRKGPEIEAFQKNFLHQISQDFIRTFAIPLDLSSFPPSFEGVKLDKSTQAVQESNTLAEVLMSDLLPTTVPVAAGLLLFGPLGMLAGAAAGRLIAHQMRQSQLKQQREEARALIEREVPLACQGFLYALQEQVELWFKKLEDLLRKTFLQQAEQLQRMLLQPHQQTMQTLERSIDLLQNIQEQLRKEATP